MHQTCFIATLKTFACHLYFLRHVKTHFDFLHWHKGLTCKFLISIYCPPHGPLSLKLRWWRSLALGPRGLDPCCLPLSSLQQNSRPTSQKLSIKDYRLRVQKRTWAKPSESRVSCFHKAWIKKNWICGSHWIQHKFCSSSGFNFITGSKRIFCGNQGENVQIESLYQSLWMFCIFFLSCSVAWLNPGCRQDSGIRD